MADFDLVIRECASRWRDERPWEARRVFHGRGHHYPGLEWLTVDRFGPTLLIGCHGPEADNARQIARHLHEQLNGVEGACVQHRQGRKTQTEVVAGQVPEELTVEEGKLKFLVQPLRNQNVGLFLDMAPTRTWIAGHSRGRRVLNLFSFTCSLSVAAIAGGATLVVNNDMSKPALEWGRRNHELNGQDARRVTMLPHNLFKSWWKIRQLGPYDLVIIDPPTNQRGSFVAEKQYGQVLKRLSEFCHPGADVIACLNSPFLNSEFLSAQMARWCPAARFRESLPVSGDFPDRYPDRGLKINRFVYA